MSIRKKALLATTVVVGVAAPSAMAAQVPAPSASGFAALLVSSTTAYAKAHGDLRRIVQPDCVEAARGQYMCSYREIRMPGDPGRCHLLQARWTPERASLYTVTLAGRTRSCRSLKDALHSLR